jgi:hypothetical protein
MTPHSIAVVMQPDKHRGGVLTPEVYVRDIYITTVIHPILTSAVSITTSFEIWRLLNLYSISFLSVILRSNPKGVVS